MEAEKTTSNEVLVTVRFVGENVNPQLLTSKLGIEPTEAHRKGEMSQKRSKLIHSTGYWGLKSPYTHDRSLKEHLEYLLDVLEPKTSALNELRDIGFSPNFYCGVFVISEECDAYIGLDLNILERLVKIGASLDCHVYCVTEELEQESIF